MGRSVKNSGLFFGWLDQFCWIRNAYSRPTVYVIDRDFKFQNPEYNLRLQFHSGKEYFYCDVLNRFQCTDMIMTFRLNFNKKLPFPTRIDTHF